MRSLPQLWLARADGGAEAFWQTHLDPFERDRLRRLTHGGEQCRRATAWGLRRWAFSRAHPAVGASEWHFAASPSGKPELAPPFAALNLHHSLSHGGNYAAVLVADAPCGVDVETPPAGLEAADVVFSPHERASVATHPRPRERFLQHWVAKEAVLKLVGTGFGNHPERLSLGITADGREARVRDTAVALPPCLAVRLWPLPDDHWIAAAVDGIAPNLQPRLAPIA